MIENIEDIREQYMRRKTSRIKDLMETIFDRVYSLGMGGTFSFEKDYKRALTYSLEAKKLLDTRYDLVFKGAQEMYETVPIKSCSFDELLD